jgi:phosphoserine phosphatase
MTKGKKLALLDIDGTLINANLGYNLIDQLVKKNLFNPEKKKEILNNKKLRSEGKITKSEEAKRFYKLVGDELKGKKTKEINKVAENVAKETLKKHSYKNLPEGLDYLHKRKIEPVLLSNAPGLVVKAMADELTEKIRKKDKGFSLEGFGPEFEAKEGVFTGKLKKYSVKSTKGLDTFTGAHLKGKEVPMILSKSGKYLFTRNVIEPKLKGKVVLGMGDSEGDLWMMMKDPDVKKTVNTAILIGKDKDLRKKVGMYGVKTYKWSKDREK